MAFGCERRDGWGLGIVTWRAHPSSEGLAFHSGPQFCHPNGGLKHIPSGHTDSCANLDWEPFGILTFFLKKGCPTATPCPGLAERGKGTESRGTEPTSAALAVSWLDLDWPVHLKERREGNCWGPPLSTPRALHRPGPAEKQEGVNPRTKRFLQPSKLLVGRKEGKGPKFVQD